MTDTLLLKLVLTPVLIAAASLAGRRWGQAVGGWMVGLQRLVLPLLALAAIVFATLAVALRLMPPRAVVVVVAAPPPPRWDLPARMVITTALVVASPASRPCWGHGSAACSPPSRCTPPS
jgi:hypothetical protein